MSNFEKQLKEKLNNEVNTINIKTTSQSILSSANFEVKEKVPFFKKLSFKIAAPIAFASILGVSILTPLLLNSSNNVDPIKPDQLNKTCYEIFAGASYISSKQDTSKLLKRAYEENNGEYNNFAVMSDYFYTYYGMLDKINSYNSKEDQYVSLTSDDEDYPFCVLINNEYKIYYKNEIVNEGKKIINGYILSNNEKYNLEIEEEHEIEEDEEEHEKTIIIYYSNYDYVKIEKEYEIENNKEEYSYSIKEIKENEQYNDISFELEGETKELEIKHHKGSKINYEYEYTYTSIDNLLINYDGVETYEGVNYNISTNTFTYNSYSHIGNKK